MELPQLKEGAQDATWDELQMHRFQHLCICKIRFINVLMYNSNQ